MHAISFHEIGSESSQIGSEKSHCHVVFEERFRTISHLFAWKDKFRRLLLRFEHISVIHYERETRMRDFASVIVILDAALKNSKTSISRATDFDRFEITSSIGVIDGCVALRWSGRASPNTIRNALHN
ncbi:hypothetical protein [Paraburkholderia humisilvae]|uniref:hypothetical protein n=1 Tax=Paraburkholderia humisilvae TaxID=627669 RepID=UPI001583D2FA